jgi:putative colanic acid biosynthesis glycosyltransferase
MKILQINTIVNSGSTGRIAEDIGKVLISNGHQSYIAYGRNDRPSASNLIKIGNDLEVYAHGIKSGIFDLHGFGSKIATDKLIKKIDLLQPDAIGLHNLHGYYINVTLLFNYLKHNNIPVLWTLFDCWSFTGHCSYFDDIGCEKYKSHCNKCPKKKKYPSSYLFDNSSENFKIKKALFTSLDRMELVVNSKWLETIVCSSFLANHPLHNVPSGIDLETFVPCSSQLREKFLLNDKKVVLGCASPWSNRKGLQDFIEVRKLLPDGYSIVLIGLNRKQINELPQGIIGIQRTEDVHELAKWYSLAEVFVNPTYQDNFPTVNLEALACGTPVITYETGGSAESIDLKTGITISKGDLLKLADSIQIICSKDKSTYILNCRERAEHYFDKNKSYLEYLNLYQRMIC